MKLMLNKNLLKKRKKAKIYVLQSMYVWTFNNAEMNIIKDNLFYGKNLNKIDILYYDKLFNGILEKIVLIDKCIYLYGNQNIKNINILELNIIRIAIFEFIFCNFLSYKIIISEALFLSKFFGSNFCYSFIKGISDFRYSLSG